MKIYNKLIISTICMLVIGLLGCQTEDELAKTNQFNFSENIEISYQKSAAIKGQFYGVFDTEKERIISIGVSDNLLKLFKMSASEFNTKILNNLNQTITKSKSELSDCLAACRENFTMPDGSKIAGRGKCKFNCWKEAALQLIGALDIPVIAGE